MRVAMNEEHMGNPMAHTADYYARDIVKAGWEFSRMGYLHSKLSLREFEAARARTAEINGCQVCRVFRGHRDLESYFDTFGGDVAKSVQTRGTPPDEALYANVTNAANYSGYSTRERLAIECAEGMGLDPQRLARDEDFWTRLKAEFSDDEVVDLVYNIACWMGMGRANHVLGMDTVCGFVPMNG